MALSREVKHKLLIVIGGLGPALSAVGSQPPVPVRKVSTAPRADDGDRLFLQPSADGSACACREADEAAHRRFFAANFNYADAHTGDACTYDHTGRYNCGACLLATGDDDCLVLDINVDNDAGSCRYWAHADGGRTVLDMAGVTDPASAAYGVATNGVGFGCGRCPYAEPATVADSRGRELYCGKGDFRVTGNACCALNGAATHKVSYTKD